MSDRITAESLLHSGNYLWYGTGHWQMYNLSIYGIGVLSKKVLRDECIELYRKHSVLTPNLRIAIEGAVKSCDIEAEERLYLVLCQASPQLMTQVRDSRIQPIPKIKFTETDGDKILAIYISKYPSSGELEESYIFTETWGNPVWDMILLEDAKKSSLDIQIYIPPKPVVEYVELESTSRRLLKIFSEVQKNLKSSTFGDQIDETTQEVHDKGDSLYSYIIPFKDKAGHVILQYDNYVEDMKSFEEYMHSYRGKCKILLIRVMPKDDNCRLEDALKDFIPKSDFHISIKKGDNEWLDVQTEVSFYIDLLIHSQEKIDCLSNCIIDLWNESKRFIASACE